MLKQAVGITVGAVLVGGAYILLTQVVLGRLNRCFEANKPPDLTPGASQDQVQAKLTDIRKVGAACDAQTPLSFVRDIDMDVALPLVAIAGGVAGYAATRKRVS